MEKHRKIAQQLDLFHSEPSGPGMVFWHPNGWRLFNKVKRHIQKLYEASGFVEISTPVFLKKELWETSGHWEKFSENMFVGGANNEEPQCALKPMSCPAHILFFKRGVLSYRSLPYRVFEFGQVHRNEPSGALNGLMRLRQFTQDDAHVVCRWQDCVREIRLFLARARKVYGDYGYHHLDVRISTRPQEYFGDDSDWSRAEQLLEQACREAKLDFQMQPGEGAFYGPKIELVLKDSQDRQWQCGTIQLDFNMPRRFELEYVDESGERKMPVMLHQAVYGSLERWIGILLETYQGNLPEWVHPQPVAIASIGEKAIEHCRQMQQNLLELGIPSVLNVQQQGIGKKIKMFHQQKVPLVLIAGEQEASCNEFVLRHRDGEQQTFSADKLLEVIQKKVSL
ncbi:threonine--tRNA ligase [Pleionea sp. CnH1-48]|nr:threonine--tRNA ligase [Pleionea sp. CnH1-48]